MSEPVRKKVKRVVQPQEEVKERKEEAIAETKEALRRWRKGTNPKAPKCFFCKPQGLDQEIDGDDCADEEWRFNSTVLRWICGQCPGSRAWYNVLAREAENAETPQSWKCPGCGDPKIFSGKSENGCDKVCCSFGFDYLNRKEEENLPVYNQTQEELQYLQAEKWALDPDFVSFQKELHPALLCALCTNYKMNPWINFGAIPSREGFPITCESVYCELRPRKTSLLWASPPSSSSDSDENEKEHENEKVQFSQAARPTGS